MKTSYTQQEILILTNSSFAQRQLCNNDDISNTHLTPEDSMEEACANGLIQELLPEVFKPINSKMYLWQMHPGFSFLQLELSELPIAMQEEFSLDPHRFLKTVWYN